MSAANQYQAFIDFLRARDRQFWHLALALLLFAVATMWLFIWSRGDRGKNENWTRAVYGPYRFEIAEYGEIEKLSFAAGAESDSMRADLALKARLDEGVASSLTEHAAVIAVEIVLEDFPNRSFQGRLAGLDKFAKANSGQGDSLLTAVFEIDASQVLLKPGMAARSVIWLDTLAQAILLPDRAVFEMDGAPVIFPRRDWPAPRPVQLGPRCNGTTMIVDGISSDEEICLISPGDGDPAQPLTWDTYKKFARETRERMKQRFAEIVKRSSRETTSESLLMAAKQGGVDEAAGRAAASIADCTSAIDRMLTLPARSEDSTQNVTVEQMRIGPGEGGKLAPLSPETQQQMKSGEKISVAVPARRDSSADTASASIRRRAPPESSKTESKPPGRE
jgi:hypothetical protein